MSANIFNTIFCVCDQQANFEKLPAQLTISHRPQTLQISDHAFRQYKTKPTACRNCQTECTKVTKNYNFENNKTGKLIFVLSMIIIYIISLFTKGKERLSPMGSKSTWPAANNTSDPLTVVSLDFAIKDCCLAVQCLILVARRKMMHLYRPTQGALIFY